MILSFCDFDLSRVYCILKEKLVGDSFCNTFAHVPDSDSGHAGLGLGRLDSDTSLNHGFTTLYYFTCMPLKVNINVSYVSADLTKI